MRELGTLTAPSRTGFPSSPTAGQMHYEAAVNRLYWYDGAAWRSASGGEHELTSGLVPPADLGFKAWTFDPILATLNAALPAGQIVFSRVPIRETLTIANLHVYVDVIGATLTSGQSFGLVYSSGGVLLGRTASQSTAWTTTGEKVMAVTVEGGQSLTVTGSPTAYVIAAAYSVGTTRPSFPRWDASRMMGNLAQKGLSGNGMRWGVANSGLTSTPPSSLASHAAASNFYWFAVS